MNGGKCLEPIDVFASLLAISQSIQSLIEECVVTFNDISECCNGSERCCRISFQRLLETSNQVDHVRLLGNVKYFIKLHLLKLSIRLGSVDLNGGGNLVQASSILDQAQCELLEFYRERLLKIQYSREQDLNSNNYILPYVTMGDTAIGKTTFNNCVRLGKYETHFPGNLGIDFCIKTCTFPNGGCGGGDHRGVSIKHQVWDTAGQEKIVPKEWLVNHLARYNPMFMFCFSMKDEKSLHESLDEWFSASLQLKDKKTEIILGLHPVRKQNEQVVINYREAVKKAWTLERSVFLEVDSQNMKNVFAPLWFLHLKYAYFKDISKLQKPTTAKKIPAEKPASRGYCF